MQIRNKLNLDKNECIYLILLFLFLFFWMVALPYNDGPDEAMRYDIPKFIYNYGYLPRGDDPRIINEIWGNSYAFAPILTYIISAFFMKIGSFFNDSSVMLLYYARFVSVIFSCLSAFVILKISDMIFSGVLKWLFVILVTFLPQFQFISAYVNCDAIAVFSVSLIIYFLIKGHQDRWKYKTCIYLGMSIGICLLSYYNTYGVILITVFYCLMDVITSKDISNKIMFISKRFLIVFIFAFLIAGWWFIRNFILYDGDILGRNAAFQCAEKYALPEYKPSVKQTIQQQNISISEMLFSMGWIESSYKSFIGTFSYMSIWLTNFIYNFYTIPLFLGFVGMIRYFVKEKNKLFYFSLILMCFMSIGISIYYSFTSDYQAQGRYCFAMLIPLGILIVRGIGQLELYIKDFQAKLINITLICTFLLISIYSLFSIYIQFRY